MLLLITMRTTMVKMPQMRRMKMRMMMRMRMKMRMRMVMRMRMRLGQFKTLLLVTWF